MPARRRRETRLKDLFRTRNAAMRNVLQTVEKVLDHDVPVLIVGESGVGKDYLAEAIHAAGNRRTGPFTRIDCATIPADLFESELFGYEKGTFTDAQSRKLGKLETARGGTVYFDEIAALTPLLQAKLLRALQEKSFTRLGGHEPVMLDARVIASSSRDLTAMLAQGDLRRDLFYRINVVTVVLPPLRERAEDIRGLVAQFAGRRKRVAADAMELLSAFPWPGNIRELRNVVERALVIGEGDSVTVASLPFSLSELVSSAAKGHWTLEQLEASYIREILRETRSNYSRAASILGINRKTLLEKRKKYGIEP
jgi:two-component system response regulator AtoC